MIRIKDIAQIADVSATTVSNVIHGNTKKVSLETIDKINRIIAEKNYIPSLGARMLAGNRSNIVGVIVGVSAEKSGRHLADPFMGELFSTLETEIFSRGSYMIFHQPTSQEEIFLLASGWRVDGVITMGISVEDNLKVQQMIEVPMVSVDVYYEGEAIVNVGLDDMGGGYSMIKYLAKRNCRKVLFLADNDIGVDHHRWRGAQKAMLEEGITDTVMRHIVIPETKERRLEFYEKHLEYFLEQDALFFASDYYATEAIAFLRKMKVNVPDDISVAGFDDNFLASLNYPGLTTVRQDIAEKGRVAVRYLFDLIKGDVIENRNIKLNTELVIRDSVK